MMWLGFAIMGAAAALSVAYNSVFVAAIPWAVLPLAIYTFGLAVAMLINTRLPMRQGKCLVKACYALPQQVSGQRAWNKVSKS